MGGNEVGSLRGIGDVDGRTARGAEERGIGKIDVIGGAGIVVLAVERTWRGEIYWFD